MAITFNQNNQTLSKIYFIDDSAGTCVDIGDYNDAVDYFPDNAAVGDSVVFSIGMYDKNKGKYQGLNFDVATQLAAGAITVVWEYARRPANGIAEWHALSNVVDNTNAFQNAGVNSVTWDVPEDWENYLSIYSGTSGFYPWIVRCRITALTNLTEGGKQASTNLTTKDYSISVSGYSEATPATLQDIYDADVAGGWGVVTKTGNAYNFNCGLRIESGCYFTTKQEVIQFLKNWDIYVLGVIKSGEVVSGDKCKYGSEFIFNLYNGDLFRGTLAYTNAEIYNTHYRYIHMSGSSVYHGHWGGYLGNRAGQKIYDIYGEGLRQFNFSYDGNVIIGAKGYGFHVETPGAILKDITCYGSSYAVRPSYNNLGDYMHECDFSGATLSPINPYQATRVQWVMDFVDCKWGTFDPTHYGYWRINSGDTYYPSWFWLTNSFLLKVIDKDNNAISGATIVLKDKNGTEVFSYTTNADGTPGQDSGSISSATAGTLTDSSKSWASDDWWFQEVYITSGTGAGQRKIIKKGNTATELQVAPDWDTTPDATSKYIIIPYVRAQQILSPATKPASSGYYWSTVDDLNPFTLTISKAGYQTYSKKFTLDKKTDWIIRLKEAKKLQLDVNGEVYKVLKPEIGTESKITQV